MSTNISTIYDAMITRIGTVLPNHVRLPNPYKPEENSELYLKQGFGLRLGPGENTNRNLCNKLSIKREFVVVLTRKVYARDDDSEKRASAEKDLLEDQFLIIEDFTNDATVNGALVSAQYVSDTGINYVFNEKDQFISTEITIAAEYFEQL